MPTQDQWADYKAAAAAYRDGDAKQAVELMKDHSAFVESRANVSKAVAKYNLGLGQFAEALALLDTAETLERPDALSIKLRVAALTGLGDWAAVSDYALGLGDDLEVGDAQTSHSIATAYLHDGKVDQAVEMCRIGLSVRPANSKLIDVLYSALVVRTAPDDLEAVLEQEIFEVANRPEHLRGLVNATREGGLTTPAFLRLYERGQANWPDAKQFKLLQRWVPRERDKPVQGGDPLVRMRKRLARLAEQHVVLREAADAFEDFDSARLTRPLISNVQNPGFLVSEKGPTDRVFVHFSGLAGDGGRDEFFDAYYSAMGATSIFVTDPSRLLCLNGVSSVAPTFDETAKALRDTIDAICPDAKITMVGPSAGGIGALSYGHAVGAERIVCFSAPTTIESEFLNRIGDRRARAVLYRLKKFVPADRMEMRVVLDRLNYKGRIDMIYGKENEIDRAHSEQLEDYDTVTLYPVKGYDKHPSILRAVSSLCFEDILNDQMDSIQRMHVSG